jgi:D-alanyl-D-alanine carboxypeptidase
LNNNPTPNKRPTVPPQKPGTNPSANKSAPNAGANRPAQGGAHGKKTIKFNKDIGLALLALLLVVALAITIIVCCIKAIVDTVRGDGQTTTPEQTVNTAGTTTGTPVQTDPVFTTPVAGAWNEGYVTVPRPNTAVNGGNLILVNYQYAFDKFNSLNLQTLYDKTLGYNTNYVLHTSDLSVSKHIVTPLTTMLADMKEANPSLTSERKILISSGFRTYEKQQELYSKEEVEGLTAKPGHSEHHTGLTIDIRIFENGKTLYLNDAEQTWIEANCAKYGFILRYTDENKDITGILNEDWHFRYVGVPHAMYMVEHDLCLEEYLDFLRKNHHYGTHDPLNYTVGETTYTIYYFPASVENTTTNIYVPSAGYEISGNNVDGFIVTVTKNS